MPKPKRATKSTSSFVGDIGTILSGTAVAQLIAVLASPVLTRIYGPEIYGLVAVFFSVSTIFGIIACLRFELAILLPKDDCDARALVWICIASTVFVAGCMVVLINQFGHVLISLTRTQKLDPVIWLLPLAVLLTGIQTTLMHWSSRCRLFSLQATSKIAETGCDTVGRLGAGINGFIHPIAILLASLGGKSVSIALMFVRLIRCGSSPIRTFPELGRIRSVANRYKRFPLISTWSAFGNALAWQSPPLFLAAFFPIQVVGLYALGMKMLQYPMNLLGGAIGRVFFQRSAEAHLSGSLPHITSSCIELVSRVAVLPVLFLAFFGPDLFQLVFGLEWRAAGTYAQLLTPWLFFWFLSICINNLVNVLQRQAYAALWSAANLALRLAALIIGGLFRNITVSLLLLGVFGALSYGFNCIYLAAAAGVSTATTARLILTITLRLLPFVSIFLMSVLFLDDEVTKVIFGLLCLGVYAFFNGPLILSQAKSIK